MDMEGKVDRILEAVSSIREAQATQVAHIADHARRLELAETDVKALNATSSRQKGATAMVVFLIGTLEAIRHFFKG